jgi:putative ABC transport system permease protein
MIFGLPLAWLQLTRQKTRLLVTIAGVSFAVISMFVQLGFRDGLYEDSITIHKTLKGDLVLISSKANYLFATIGKSFPRQRLYTALSVDGVASAGPLYFSGGEWKVPQERRSHPIFVMAFKPDKPVFNLPEINQNINKIEQTDVVLFDRLSRSNYGSIVQDFEQGKPIVTEVGDRRIKVGGLFTLGGGIMNADGFIVTSDVNFMRLFNRPLDKVHIGLITLKPGVDAQAAIKNLEAKLPNDVKVMTLQSFMEMEKDYVANNTPIGFIFNLGAGMGFIIGAVIVYLILYTDVSNHMAEYATLKAMGYKDRYLLGIVLQEAIIMAIIGYVPGFALSIGIYDLVKNATRLPTLMTLARALSVMILTIVMCFISGAIAVRKLQSADPADIF